MGFAIVAVFDVKKKGWSFGHNARLGERNAPPEWGRVDCQLAHIIDACFPRGIMEWSDKRLLGEFAQRQWGSWGMGRLASVE